MSQVRSHSQAFIVMWCLSREWDLRRTEFEVAAAHCMELAAANVPCVEYGADQFPMLKFAVAMWDDKYTQTLSAVFAAYVRHGYIDTNLRLTGTKECPDHYRKVFGKLPIEAAVRTGNIHTAEQLVLHGADTELELDDLDFLDFVKRKFGCDYPFPPDEAARTAAATRLAQASMRFRIETLSAEVVAHASPPPRRRARAL